MRDKGAEDRVTYQCIKSKANIEIYMGEKKITSLILVFKIIHKLLPGRKPPEEIRVIAKLNELNVRKLNISNTIKIPRVNKQ